MAVRGVLSHGAAAPFVVAGSARRRRRRRVAGVDRDRRRPERRGARAPPPRPPAPARRAAGSAHGWLLAVCCVAQFMVILDLSIVNVALPSIQSSLGFSSPDLQWVVDAYAITFAGFLLLGGRAADHFGQRRMFVAALAAVRARLAVGGLAPDQAMLIVARAAAGPRRRADGGVARWRSSPPRSRRARSCTARSAPGRR